MNKTRAIELLKNFNLYDEPNCMGYWDCDECVEALYMGIEAIEQAPKRGRNASKKGFLCSVCWFGDFGGFHGYEPKFCPNCGARME